MILVSTPTQNVALWSHGACYVCSIIAQDAIFVKLEIWAKRGLVKALDWLVGWLEEERLRQGMSQRDVEDRGGLSHGTVSRTVKHGSAPDTDTLERWAQALGYAPATVLAIIIGRREDTEVSDLREKFERLSPQDRRYVLDNMQLLLRRQQKQKGRQDTQAVETEQPDKGVKAL
jgi:transcriptional regulator with XRE-family HTH domain